MRRMARVFDVGRGYHPLPSETQYGASSYWVDFDRSGRLVTTSYDGVVRIYAAEHCDKAAKAGHIVYASMRETTGRNTPEVAKVAAAQGGLRRLRAVALPACRS